MTVNQKGKNRIAIALKELASKIILSWLTQMKIKPIKNSCNNKNKKYL
jgi:hypothetical protein